MLSKMVLTSAVMGFVTQCAESIKQNLVRPLYLIATLILHLDRLCVVLDMY